MATRTVPVLNNLLTIPDKATIANTSTVCNRNQKLWYYNSCKFNEPIFEQWGLAYDEEQLLYHRKGNYRDSGVEVGNIKLKWNKVQQTSWPHTHFSLSLIGNITYDKKLMSSV